MRKADWAVAHHALSDAMPTALLGLVACGAVLYGTVEGPRDDATAALAPLTWPLMPLVAAAMWAGIGIFGEMKVSMAHTLARPLHRGRWLAVRAVVHAATLGAVGAVVHFFSANLWAADLGPPLAFVVGLIIIAFGLGIVAGACAATETGAVGGTVVGLALTVAPVLTLVDLYGVSWPRVTSALGGWLWPAALVGGATLVWPLWHVVRYLPLRQPRRTAVSVATIAASHLLAIIVIWQPAASRATSAEHGERIAVDGVVDGPRVVYTGTDGTVDGVYVERDGRRIPFYGGAAQRSHIVEAKLSPDGGAIALLVRPFEAESRRIVVVDLHSGERLSTEVDKEMSLGRWAPDSKKLAFIVDGESGRRTQLVVANLSDATIRELSLLPAWRTVLGWRRGSIIVGPRWPREHEVLHLVPTTAEGATRSIELSMPFRVMSLAGSASAFAWLTHDGQRHAPRGSAKRWTLMIQAWEPGAEPVAVDLQAWVSPQVTAFGFVDDDHVYVELTESYVARDRGQLAPPKRMLVVRQDGVIRSVVDQRRGKKLYSLTGPPQGPWLATNIFGGSGRLHPNGRTMSRTLGRNLGNRSTPWIPMRDVPNGIEFIDHAGRPTSLKLTGAEESR